MENIKELHCSYFSIPHSFYPATYSAAIDCRISINIAKPFMDFPHRFFHCSKDMYQSTLFVTGYLWYTSNSRAAAEVSYVRNLYKFVHKTREIQMCTA
jgi:hypothetical protein